MCCLLMLWWTVEMPAQDYAAQWKQVKAAQEKGLPKSVANEARKLFVLAQEHRNVPQMLRAYLVWMQSRADVSSDSLEVDMRGLVEWTDTCSRPADQAVLRMVTGLLKQKKREFQGQWQENTEESVRYFKQALALEGEGREELFPLLVNTPATAYVPVTETGEASLVFDHDLLSLFRQALVEALGVENHYGRNQNDWVAALFDRDEVYYRGLGRMEAALQVALHRDTYQVNNQDKEARKKYLSDLLERYAGCDRLAEVEYRLAQMEENENDYAGALQRVRRAMKSYPRYAEMDRLRMFQQQLLTPTLGLSVLHELYPGEETDLSVTSRNVLRAEVTWYKVSDQEVKEIEQHLDEDRTWLNRVKRSARKVSSRVLEQDSLPFRFIQDRKQKVQVPDQIGFYLLEVRPLECGEYPINKVAPAYLLQCVTRLRLVVFPVTKTEQEVHVLDDVTGHPVPGAVVRRWQSSYQGGRTVYRLLESLTTDENGMCKIPMKEGDRIFLQAVSGQDKGRLYAQQQSFHYSSPGQPFRSEVQLYTDRALYRPGQQVQVSLLAYQMGGRDSAAVQFGKPLKLRLTDNRYKELQQLEVTTDEYGGATATFDLPADCASGTYRIRSEEGSCTFRVEEYKRPTFDVKWLPVTGSYALGDTVTMRGRAETFNGLPVQHARVTVRSVYCKMSWFYVSEERPLRTDTLLTDVEGYFSVRMPLVLPEGIELEEMEDHLRVRPYSRFCVTAQVTSAAGESHEASSGVPVSRQPLQLTAQIPQLAEQTTAKEWLIRLYNLSQEPQNREVEATLVRVADRKEVWSGSIEANKAYVPYQLDTLPSGRYRLQLSCDSARWDGEFVLFSLKDRQPVDSVPLWVYVPSHEIDGEHPARMQVGSSLEKAWLIYELHDSHGRVLHEELELNNEVRMVEFPYREEYGDGFRTTVVLVRDGKVHTQSDLFSYRQPDKQLKTEWISFRDKLQPGEKETWKLRVTLPDGRPADARVMAVMYDASLDALTPHHWALHPVFSRSTSSVSLWNWVWRGSAYANLNFEYLKSYRWKPQAWDRFDPAWFNISGLGNNGIFYLTSVRSAALRKSPAVKETAVLDNATVVTEEALEADFGTLEEKLVTGGTTTDGTAPADVKLRSDFRETAFFLPMLRTDAQGDVQLEFTLPDALTEWHLMGVAHTKEMFFTDRIDEKVRAQKLFSIQPALPRFLRQGDEAALNATVQNQSGTALTGTVHVELTDSSLTRVIWKSSLPFEVEAGGSSAVTFRYPVQVDEGEVICRIYAQAENFTDGEQQRLPVLSDRVWVEESRAVYLNQGEETVSLKNLLNGGRQWNTTSSLTAEITHNPLWTVMQSLSALSKPSTDNAVDLASAYYAQALLMEIARLQPSWAAEGGIIVDSLSAYGWLGKLEDLQREDGGFGWFKGMYSSSYITRLVAGNLVRLQHLCSSLPDAGRVTRMVRRAMLFLDQQAQETYRRMQENEKKHNVQPIPGEDVVHYLYLCALQERRLSSAGQEAVDYFINHLPKALNSQSILPRAMSSVVLARYGKPAEAEKFLNSVMEYSVATEELGRYFDTQRAEYSWRNYRIPTQTLVIETLSALNPGQVIPSPEAPALDTSQVLAQLAQWLINQKRTQQWETSAATADALYALWLACPQAREPMKADRVYEKQEYTASDYPAMPQEWTFRRDPAVLSSPMAWAVVSVRSLVQLDEVTSSQTASGLQIGRRYYKEVQEAGRIRLQELKAGTPLQVGDKVVCRLTVSTDRDMDFVTLTAGRPACLEPVEQLSGYRAGYYQAPRDQETLFCMDQMRKGKYTFDETFYVTRAGEYRTGVAKVQCTYCPEFNAHTDSQWIKVKE